MHIVAGINVLADTTKQKKYFWGGGPVNFLFTGCIYITCECAINPWSKDPSRPMEERKSKYEFINIFEMVKLINNRFSVKNLISSEYDYFYKWRNMLYHIARISVMFFRV